MNLLSALWVIWECFERKTRENHVDEFCLQQAMNEMINKWQENLWENWKERNRLGKSRENERETLKRFSVVQQTKSIQFDCRNSSRHLPFFFVLKAKPNFLSNIYRGQKRVNLNRKKIDSQNKRLIPSDSVSFDDAKRVEIKQLKGATFTWSHLSLSNENKRNSQETLPSHYPLSW